jgi:hypothetical protein
VFRDSFPADGATKTEWRGCCGDVTGRTFYHALKKLTEHGHVKQLGTKYRIVAQVSR